MALLGNINADLLVQILEFTLGKDAKSLHSILLVNRNFNYTVHSSLELWRHLLSTRYRDLSRGSSSLLESLSIEEMESLYRKRNVVSSSFVQQYASLSDSPVERKQWIHSLWLRNDESTAELMETLASDRNEVVGLTYLHAFGRGDQHDFPKARELLWNQFMANSVVRMIHDRQQTASDAIVQLALEIVETCGEEWGANLALFQNGIVPVLLDAIVFRKHDMKVVRRSRRGGFSNRLRCGISFESLCMWHRSFDLLKPFFQQAAEEGFHSFMLPADYMEDEEVGSSADTSDRLSFLDALYKTQMHSKDGQPLSHAKFPLGYPQFNAQDQEMYDEESEEEEEEAEAQPASEKDKKKTDVSIPKKALPSHVILATDFTVSPSFSFVKMAIELIGWCFPRVRDAVLDGFGDMEQLEAWQAKLLERMLAVLETSENVEILLSTSWAISKLCTGVDPVMTKRCFQTLFKMQNRALERDIPLESLEVQYVEEKRDVYQQLSNRFFADCGSILQDMRFEPLSEAMKEQITATVKTYADPFGMEGLMAFMLNLWESLQREEHVRPNDVQELASFFVNLFLHTLQTTRTDLTEIFSEEEKEKFREEAAAQGRKVIEVEARMVVFEALTIATETALEHRTYAFTQEQAMAVFHESIIALEDVINHFSRLVPLEAEMKFSSSAAVAAGGRGRRRPLTEERMHPRFLPDRIIKFLDLICGANVHPDRRFVPHLLPIDTEASCKEDAMRLTRVLLKMVHIPREEFPYGWNCCTPTFAGICAFTYPECRTSFKPDLEAMIIHCCENMGRDFQVELRHAELEKIVEKQLQDRRKYPYPTREDLELLELPDRHESQSGPAAAFLLSIIGRQEHLYQLRNHPDFSVHFFSAGFSPEVTDAFKKMEPLLAAYLKLPAAYTSEIFAEQVIGVLANCLLLSAANEEGVIAPIPEGPSEANQWAKSRMHPSLKSLIDSLDAEQAQGLLSTIAYALSNSDTRFDMTESIQLAMMLILYRPSIFKTNNCMKTLRDMKENFMFDFRTADVRRLDCKNKRHSMSVVTRLEAIFIRLGRTLSEGLVSKTQKKRKAQPASPSSTAPQARSSSQKQPKQAEDNDAAVEAEQKQLLDDLFGSDDDEEDDEDDFVVVPRLFDRNN